MDLENVTKSLKELEVYSQRKVSELFAGNYKSAFRGAGLEVKQIREYSPGDEVKHIDWLSSARQDTLYVKEFTETRELTTMLIVDGSASMNFGSSVRLKNEVVLQTAAILLYSALKNNDAMGLIYFTDTIEAYIPAKKGQAQLLTILRTMIELFGNSKYKQADARIALDFFNRVVKKQAITFLISDEISQETSKAMRIAQAKHDFVFVNVYDSFERQPTALGLVQIENPETGEQMIMDLSSKKLIDQYMLDQDERKVRFEKLLRKYSIDVVDIATDADVYKELLVFFKKRQMRN